MSRKTCFLLVGLGLVLTRALPARGETGRFAVVNLSGPELPEPVVQEAEREYARLRPGMAPLTDPVMRHLLTTGETPGATVPRLLDEAQAKRNSGECGEAVRLASTAEELTLQSIAVDEARDLLKRAYTLLVLCEHTLERPGERDHAARRLRALVSLRPDEVPAELWEQYVATATAGPAKVELQVDSEPPNAQVIINFHSEGVTPHTLKVAPGEVIVEVQKEGFKKAFRRVHMAERSERIVFRLIDVQRDRVELTAAAVQVISREEQLEDRKRTLAQLAQWARVDMLMLLKAQTGQVTIRFFDVERGALSQETILSPYDAETGRIEALAQRPTPAQGSHAGGAAGVLAPVSRDGQVGGKAARGLSPVAEPALLGEATRAGPRRRTQDSAPWWGWLIAAAVAGGIAAIVIADQPRRRDSINVNARF